MPARRSPRSVERFCKGLQLESLAFEQIAVLLSLAQLSGWSADRIALKLYDLYHVNVTAEQIWNLHQKWILDRDDSNELEHAEQVIAECVLADAEITLTHPDTNIKPDYVGRPLSKTTKPTTVACASRWSWLPNVVNERPMCPGFDAQSRRQSTDWLAACKKKSSWGKLTPIEDVIVAQFGSKVESIFRDVMRRWNRRMQEKIRTDRQFRMINQQAHVLLIVTYLRKFQSQFEEAFGYTEEAQKSNQLNAAAPKGTVLIRSTGYGAKLVLGLMMADRIHVARAFREQERLQIGLLEVDHTTLKEDEKKCPVCQDEMGVNNLDGVKETCIEMAICCGQCFGENCLKTWFGVSSSDGSTKSSCPYCRYNVPKPLLVRFMGYVDESDGYNTDDNDAEQLIAEEYQQLVNMLNPNSTPPSQSDLNHGSQVNEPIGVAASGHLMDIDNDDFHMEG